MSVISADLDWTGLALTLTNPQVICIKLPRMLFQKLFISDGQNQVESFVSACTFLILN